MKHRGNVQIDIFRDVAGIYSDMHGVGNDIAVGQHYTLWVASSAARIENPYQIFILQVGILKSFPTRRILDNRFIGG